MVKVPVVHHIDNLESTLARIDRYKSGQDILNKWALSLLCRIIDREMRKVKRAFTMKTNEITPEFVEAWSFSDLQSVTEESFHLVQTPVCMRSDETRKEEGKEGPSGCMYTPSLLLSWLTSHRSFRSSPLQISSGPSTRIMQIHLIFYRV